MIANYLERISAAFGETQKFPFHPALHCLAFVGSHSHGTYVPPSDPDAIDDVDLMGILVPPRPYILGLREFEHWTLQRDELDVVCYDLRKFVRLLLKGNPNVLGLLWLKDEHYLVRSQAFDTLRASRHLFAAKSVYASFAGYASGQMHKMTSYSPEIQAEIDGLTAELEKAGWHLQDIMDRRSLPMPVGGDAELRNHQADRLRHLRAKYHQAYMGEKRRNLVVKHGYDTKNAAHLVRLLSMCVEFLRDGEMRVYREHDAEELRSIKRGEWSLEAVKEYAEHLFTNAKIARDNSYLPDVPDFEAVNDLLVDLLERELFPGHYKT